MTFQMTLFNLLMGEFNINFVSSSQFKVFVIVLVIVSFCFFLGSKNNSKMNQTNSKEFNGITYAMFVREPDATASIVARQEEELTVLLSIKPSDSKTKNLFFRVQNKEEHIALKHKATFYANQMFEIILPDGKRQEPLNVIFEDNFGLSNESRFLAVFPTKHLKGLDQVTVQFSDDLFQNGIINFLIPIKKS